MDPKSPATPLVHTTRISNGKILSYLNSKNNCKNARKAFKMIKFDKNIRSDQTEIMDSLDFQGTEMNNLMRDLQWVNRWLGGNNITTEGLGKLLKNHPKSQE